LANGHKAEIIRESPIFIGLQGFIFGHKIISVNIFF
jgi:hypothetical protein